MSKLRKFLFVLLTAALFIFFLYKPMGLIRLPFISIESYEAVPAKTLLFFEQQLNQPDNESSEIYLKCIKKDPLIARFQEDFSSISNLFSRYPDYQQTVFQKGRLLSALQHSPSGGLDYLHILDIDGGSIELDSLLNSPDILKNKKSVYRGISLYTLYYSEEKSFVISQYRNLILLGRYPLLVEDAIEQLKTSSSNLVREPVFRKLSRNGTTNALRLFVNMKALPDFLMPFLRYDYREVFENVSLPGDWIFFDWKLEEKEVMGEGKLYTSEGTSALETLHNLEPRMHHRISSILPDHSALVVRTDLGEALAPLASRAGDFEKLFFPQATGELAFVITEPYSSTFRDEQFFLMKIKDPKTAAESIAAYTDRFGGMEDINYQTYSIKRIISDKLFPFLPETFIRFTNPYITIIEDYAVFCNSRQAMEIWLDKYIAGQTLARNAAFLVASVAMTEKSVMMLYVNPGYIQPLINAVVKEKFHFGLDAAFANYEQLGNIRVQLHSASENLEAEAVISYQAQPDEMTGIMWKTALATEAAIPPAVIRDPIAGEYRLLIQDTLHRIYMLNRGGDILWTKMLDARVLSDFHQIDYYKNGDYQLLFNTSSGIYLIDKEGKALNEYPIRLQSPATNGLMVVDFDGLGGYGYFLGCENGNLYGFEASGRPLAGWNPRLNVGIVRYPLRHFEQEGKDYIIALNEEGKLQVFKKNGNLRFDPLSFETSFNSPVFFQADDSDTRIVATDRQGKTRVVKTSGKSFNLRLKVGDNENVQFAFADIAGDRRKDYVVMSRDELAAYAYQGNQLIKLFHYKFETDQSLLFSLLHPLTNREMVATLCRDKKQIQLFDDEGELLPYFPLAGTSKFVLIDLFDDKKVILVVAYEDQLYTYKIE